MPTPVTLGVMVEVNKKPELEGGAFKKRIGNGEVMFGAR